MGFKAGQCNKASTPQGIFIMKPSLEGWPTGAKETPPHEVRLTLLDITQYFNVLVMWYFSEGSSELLFFD